MAKGKKATRPPAASATAPATGPPADQPPTEVVEESGPLLCSYCGTTFDRQRTQERTCWLCGKGDFVDAAEVETRRRNRGAEKKELCCPNPRCERPPELLRNTEKYCGGCGAELEKATVDVWFRKWVDPAVGEDTSRLSSGRDWFVETAWRLQLTKDEAEAKLDEYRALKESARAEEAARLAVGGEPEPSIKQDGRAGAGGRQRPARRPPLSHWDREWDRRHKALRVKYGVIIACFLVVGIFVLFVGGGAPFKKRREEVGPTPLPSPEATQPPPPTPTPPPMVEVGGGEFTMGRDASEGSDRYESPPHRVTVEPFLMDVYEVTREEYQKCVEAGKCAKPAAWRGDSYPAGTGRLPVTGVTWEDANNYAVWAGKSLPTEEQWEFAARGGDGRLYPWGREWVPGRANLGGTQLAEVGTYPGQSPFGIFDLLGNAQEWTRSEGIRYPDRAVYLSSGPAPERLRVIRGGSYRDAARSVSATYRNALRMSAEESYAQTGFRCVREIDRR
jgi:formylglycine-generating enzyme required for sulfatase activity